MTKTCITIVFICFTLLVLFNSSNSRYLLVELNGSPDINVDAGYKIIGGPKMPEPEQEPTDDSEPETYYYLPNLPEDDEEGVMPEQEKEPIRRGYRNLNLTQSPNAAGEGSRSSK